ncbi:hypothetical protein GDO86_001364 [Hymenochirus boettgeri]|uniref:Leucine-rich repeat-containing protein 19 n=1 Tax=Hymenochirus boettgeri TaxID=247094 RepID=A0A8T2KKR8_9PIPI|nr:hypothetical protein GDO86_001364 [Hymenochirus boettgeri]
MSQVSLQPINFLIERTLLSNTSLVCMDKCNCTELQKKPSLTELHILKNNITILTKEFFCELSKLEILNLSHNSIKKLDQFAFKGLTNLKILDLSYNQISALHSNIGLSSPYLKFLYLHNNSLTSLDSKQAISHLNSTLHVTLSGNPWKCDCSLATSLNNSNIKIGNSWTFLIGVVVVGIFTSLLILFAVKFPSWYDYLLSYNHHRLREEAPNIFQEEFNVDEKETVIVFEQIHSFVPEDGGFIEDKYIDDWDLKGMSTPKMNF